MIRNILFQVHWFIGITAGLVLAVVGFTGGMLSLEGDILRAINPGILTVAPEGERLSPQAMIDRAKELLPDASITSLTLSQNPEDAARIQLAPPPGERRGPQHYVNPYTGKLLGEPRGEAFLNGVENLHRRLLTETIGKQVVGVSTITLIVLALSGLYLRWPRRLGSLRTWFMINPRKQGRSFLWELHSVIGTWVLPFYLLAALTGLYFSYEWYRNGLYSIAGVEQPVRRGPPAGAGPEGQKGQQRDRGKSGRGPDAMRQPAPTQERIAVPDLDKLWNAFEVVVPAYSTATLRFPARPDEDAEFNYQVPNPPHSRANNQLTINPVTGAPGKHVRYAEKPLKERLLSSMLPLHSAEFFGLGGLLAMMLASLLMPLFAITGWMLYLDRRAKKQEKREAIREVVTQQVKPSPASFPGADDRVRNWLIGFASQSGVAERLAWQTAGALQGEGVSVEVRPLSELNSSLLAAAQRALFVVSTFGDGEPPDNARAFNRRVMGQVGRLKGLRYGLLSLGDREYGSFCGFGRRLGEWLHLGGAETLFDPVEVDRTDAATLNVWKQRISELNGGEAHWDGAKFQNWRLEARRVLNPGSQGLPTFHVELTPHDPNDAPWQAGDIVEISVPAESPAHTAVIRDYSIASLPGDGKIELLVRQARSDSGEIGRGAGLLTERANSGSLVKLRIRRNSAFHEPERDCPMILIGNGTGLAGLRGHLKARIAAGRQRNWLIFGERNAACDFYYAEEIRAWQASGDIERLDLVFSRDATSRVYVQDLLRQAHYALCAWVDEGAAIYVCGSAEGMAPGVDQVLRNSLGDSVVDALVRDGRYRRDVY